MKVVPNDFFKFGGERVKLIDIIQWCLVKCWLPRNILDKRKFRIYENTVYLLYANFLIWYTSNSKLLLLVIHRIANSTEPEQRSPLIWFYTVFKRNRPPKKLYLDSEVSGFIIDYGWTWHHCIGKWNTTIFYLQNIFRKILNPNIEDLVRKLLLKLTDQDLQCLQIFRYIQ